MMCWIIHLILTLLAFRKFFTEPERAERRNISFCVSWIVHVEATTVSIFRSGLVGWQKDSKALFFSDVMTVIKFIYWTNICKSKDQTLSAQPWCCYHIFTECIIKKTPRQQIKATDFRPDTERVRTDDEDNIFLINRRKADEAASLSSLSHHHKGKSFRELAVKTL